MSDPPFEVADLFQAELDEPLVAELFADLAAHTEVIEVRAKGGTHAMVGSGTISLEEAQALLTSRAVRGVQVRYRFEGEVWLDTLMAGTDRVRLVRTRAPVPPAR